MKKIAFLLLTFLSITSYTQQTTITDLPQDVFYLLITKIPWAHRTSQQSFQDTCTDIQNIARTCKYCLHHLNDIKFIQVMSQTCYKNMLIGDLFSDLNIPQFLHLVRNYLIETKEYESFKFVKQLATIARKVADEQNIRYNDNEKYLWCNYGSLDKYSVVIDRTHLAISTKYGDYLDVCMKEDLFPATQHNFYEQLVKKYITTFPTLNITVGYGYEFTAVINIPNIISAHFPIAKCSKQSMSKVKLWMLMSAMYQKEKKLEEEEICKK